MKIYLTCEINISTEIVNRTLWVEEQEMEHLISPELSSTFSYILNILKGSISINGPNYAGEF